jgi:hypothetical protein
MRTAKSDGHGEQVLDIPFASLATRELCVYYSRPGYGESEFQRYHDTAFLFAVHHDQR